MVGRKKSLIVLALSDMLLIEYVRERVVGDEWRSRRSI
jgi:hypothetical protein